MWPLIVCHSPLETIPYLSHPRSPNFGHCVTSSLAFDNWGQEYCQTLGYRPNPSIPRCDFQCLIILSSIQKFSLLIKLRQRIKHLRMDRNRKKLTLHVKKRPSPVIRYLKCHCSRTQTPDGKHENRSNSWVWSKSVSNSKYFWQI